MEDFHPVSPVHAADLNSSDSRGLVSTQRWHLKVETVTCLASQRVQLLVARRELHSINAILPGRRVMHVCGSQRGCLSSISVPFRRPLVQPSRALGPVLFPCQFYHERRSFPIRLSGRILCTRPSTMAPTQATLGYVKPTQMTIGFVEVLGKRN
jgi:hypothetical protein